MVIQRILSTLVVVTSITLTAQVPQTLAEQSCFLQGTNGQNIDLGHLCGGGAPHPPKSNASTNQTVFRVPIKRRDSGIPVVDVTFNGKHTFEMLFDTGASGITISTDMASVMGLKPERGSFSQTAGGVVPIGISKVASVKAGELVSSSIEIAINPALPIGLLGQSFYGHYDVMIKEDTIELRAR
ncbi:retropepsin-like aspartic protease [Crocosphaera sp. XPORK-15E]|uniref:retropepsin-like aspartic protease family protein n=1 Tax=Crocosphaera sp. XPORK-15E TaxID=3110247 RepID=UPI002B217E40|nr:retropepsin-like aspartic protease [Crocosphaera sp. XPORK-15E]MEA5534380.1 retropepsin-like aspartic protease [Crocosphaera sp. XPORK-15E]